MSKRHSTGNGGHVPAVSYVRMSSDKQDASPDQQRNELVKLAERGGFQLIREYFDDAISGDRTEKRKAFQRMIADAERGEFKAILCWDQDRFGRFDSIEAGRWIYPLRQAGVSLVTVAQGTIDWSDFAGRLVYNVTQEAKHAFLRDLSRNVLRGKMKAASAGVWMTKAPYAYVLDKTTKTLLVGDQHEVGIVRRIFHDYQSGLSVRAIAFALNAERLFTSSGKPWSAKTVLEKLTNPAYAGRYRWNAETQGKYHAIRDGEIVTEFTSGLSDSSEWFVIEDHHEAIIEPTLFDAVQRMLPERKQRTTPKRDGGEFLFTKLLRCGTCGAVMYGAGGCRTPGYTCSRHSHTGLCDGNRVLQDELREVLLAKLESHFTNQKVVARLRDRLLTKVASDVPTADPADLQRQLAKLDADLVTARRNMALAGDDGLRRDYEAVVRELRQDRDRLEKSLHVAQKPPGRTRDEQAERIDKAVSMLSRLREAFHKISFTMQRELLRNAIATVDVWSQRDPNHKRRFSLERGWIHLRPEMWLPVSENLLPSS